MKHRQGKSAGIEVNSSFNRMTEDLEKLPEAKGAGEKTADKQRRAKLLRATDEITSRISSSLTLEELLPHVVASIRENFNYGNVNVFLVDPGSGNLLLKASAPIQAAAMTGRILAPDGSIIGRVNRSGKARVVNDVTRESGYVPVPQIAGVGSELIVPIRMNNEILGVLDVWSIEPGAFDKTDLFVVQTLADHIANPIENALLYQKTREITVLEERNRLAREIHDTLAQGFTGIVLQLEAAEQVLGQDVNQARQHLDRARRLARESLAEARRSVRALRPQALEGRSLTDTLRREVADFNQTGGAQASFTVSGRRKALLQDVESTLLRICQESLTNVRKHARASQVEVRLIFTGKAVTLVIRDNGRGFNTEAPAEGTFGLVGMRERTRLQGGTLVVQSEGGKGTLVDVSLPVARR
jgi:signal transduction histidine kinase